MNPPLQQMKAPGDKRDGIWRDGVLQIKVTTACDLSCKNCSVAVGQLKKLKKIWYMEPHQFRTALRSLKGYTGVVGMFGGNATLHPKFYELCKIFQEEFPDKDQRGLWSNRLFGHGAICRETFSPIHSNLNVHESQEAWDEMRRDWPEARVIPSGLTQKSMHGPIFGSMQELGLSEAEMWDKVSNCYVNKSWSAEITLINGELRGYFCEIAATMAELDGDGSLGVPIVPDWWRKPMADFEHQVKAYCTKCLIPLNARKVDASGKDLEEYTAVWKPVMATIKGRPMIEVMDLKEIEGGEPATKYLDGSVLAAKV